MTKRKPPPYVMGKDVRRDPWSLGLQTNPHVGKMTGKTLGNPKDSPLDLVKCSLDFIPQRGEQLILI